MKSLIVSIAIVGVIGLAVGTGAGALTTSDVTATVTVQNISVSVTDGIVDYGTIAAGASQDTLPANLGDLQTATNDGNVTETFNIKGTNSGSWTLASTASGATNYKHEFSKDAFATPGTALTTPGYQTLASGIIAGNSQTFDLKITTPPTATDFTEQSVNVTVQATI